MEMEVFEIEEPVEENGCRRRYRRIRNRLYSVPMKVWILLAIGFTFVLGSSVGIIYRLRKDPTCTTQACKDATFYIKQSMKKDIKPCDNFYSFACESFLRNTNIPKGKDFVSHMMMINDNFEEKLVDILDYVVSYKEENETKYVKLIRKFYTACNNKTAIRAAGLKYMKEIIRDLGGWPLLEGKSWTPTYKWYEMSEKLRTIGFPSNYIVFLEIYIDVMHSTQHQGRLNQAITGMSSEDLRKGNTSDRVVDYLKYMTRVAKIFGATVNATKELEKSLEFEIELAKMIDPPPLVYNLTALYNPISINELDQKYPIVPDWKAFLKNLIAIDNILEDDEILLVPLPSYYEKLTAFLPLQSPRTIQNYLIWRVVQESIPYLTDNLRVAKQEFETKSVSHISNDKRFVCAIDASESFRMGLTAMYIREYFDEEILVGVQKIVDDIANELEKIIKSLNWMDENTKAMALEKLAKMTRIIGYPKDMNDEDVIVEYYEELDFSSTSDYLKLAQLAYKHDMDYDYRQLRTPAYTDDWTLFTKVTVANAFYKADLNSMEIPVGLLQHVFYNISRPRFMNYGAIGTIIGHEFGHSFGYESRQVDQNRNIMYWWGNDSAREFDRRLQCLANQYSTYMVPEVGMLMNGTLTLEETLADNIGTKAAYLAYKTTIERDGEELRLTGLEDYSPEQMFWITHANQWCIKYTRNALEHRLRYEQHPPGSMRVLGPLKNLQEFANDFECAVGSNMNPKDKCELL